MTAKSGENTLKLLEEYYKAAKEQKDAWDFFLNTADYVGFVEKNSQLSEAVKRLEEQHKQAYEVFKKVDDRAIQELQKASKTLTDIVGRLNINLEPINTAVKELRMYNEGHILSSMSQAHRLDAYLFDIARNLKASGFESAIQQFIDNQKSLTFSQTLPLRNRAEEELEAKRETELWGAWEDFPFISRIVFDGVNLTEELVDAENQNDKMKKWALMNYIGTRTELGVMKARKKADSELVFFKVSDFRNKLDRIHKYLLTELLSDEGKPQRLDFDLKKSTLYFADEEITISKRAENDAHELLRTIFNDKAKVWNSDEVLDDWKVSFDGSRVPKNKVYQAGRAVNRIVAQETKIKDFLVVSTKTVAINRKYLGG